MPFEGKWLDSFGRPERAGSWIAFGESGTGKTSFMMQLAKYLSGFGKVAYNSLEQGLSLSFQSAWKRESMGEVGNNIVMLQKESLNDLRDRLSKKRSPDVIIVDSVHYWLRFGVADYMALLNDFRNKLFVFVAHEKNNQPKGSVAQYIMYNSDIKIRTMGYKAFVTTRFQDDDNGEGGADYVIWEQGANDYWIDKL
jgi:replication-associated recombination protein RarA